ncbi:hypothetical protein VTN00DRAFT_341 [Thermoascus crustaceus]|uniref:uncharacterized protein n=1 Tax=Thermoascus crustaceus TaxID=5088 RepID=UPI003744A53D
MSPQPPFFKPTTVARAMSIVARAYERPGDNSMPPRRVAALADKDVTGLSLERWLPCPFRSQSRLCVPRSAHKSVPWLRPGYFCTLSYHGHVILGASCSSTCGLSLAAILCFCNPSQAGPRPSTPLDLTNSASRADETGRTFALAPLDSSRSLIDSTGLGSPK